MSKNNQNKNISDGQNRCRRCNRPLIDPTDYYGWRCAQIMGLNNYHTIADSLDSNELLLYNAYVSKYLADDNTLSDNLTIDSNISDNSSLSKVSFLPTTNWQKASKIIERNATAIKNAGLYYGVNPAIIAACIYTEQTTNVNIVDHLTDLPAYFADTSIGIGQVKVSTAKMLEDNGYIDETRPPHSKPEPRPFGIQAKKEYDYMRQLLGLY